MDTRLFFCLNSQVLCLGFFFFAFVNILKAGIRCAERSLRFRHQSANERMTTRNDNKKTFRKNKDKQKHKNYVTKSTINQLMKRK